MDWFQIGTLIGVNVALIATMITLIVWAVNKLDSDVAVIAKRLDGHAARIDQLHQQFQATMSIQSSRSDQLYGMFIDLLKESKK